LPNFSSVADEDLGLSWMQGGQNSWGGPEWHAIRREAALVRHLLGSGVTALGQANYADKLGVYYTAFFGLSVGLERLAKLILVADHAISNGGQMADQKVVRKFGHRLIHLLNTADGAAQKHKIRLDFSRPTSSIGAKIVECLDAFADAGRGRYANFAALGDPNLGQEEPISKWWGEVAELILKEHYYGKQAQERAIEKAKEVERLLSPAVTLHFNETGQSMDDVLSSSIRTGQNALVQQYGRYYALAEVRWLVNVFSELSRAACSNKIYAFWETWACLQDYMVDNRVLKTWKIWPLA
jgi:hypothetical protein